MVKFAHNTIFFVHLRGSVAIATFISGMIIGYEERYYTVSNAGASISMIDMKKICLLTKLSEGVIFQRWMGTVSTSENSRKYICVSLVKETLDQKRYTWDAFAKRILDLPPTAFVPTCEGLAVDGAVLYLIQMYSHTEDINTHLSSGIGTGRRRSLLVEKRARFAQEILLGMEFLVSHGMSHPGLSIFKVRVTSDETCQFYDFCLREDASKVAADMKLEPNYQSPLHPTESIARNEHDIEADVWYTAFTIYEIFAKGNELSDGHVLLDLTGVSSMMSAPKPVLCPSEIYGVLKECCNDDLSQRPTFATLRTSFGGFDRYKREDTIGAPQTRKIGDSFPSDSYESMNGGIPATQPNESGRIE